MNALIFYITLLTGIVTGSPTIETIDSGGILKNASGSLLVGKHSGEILKCPHDAPSSCEMIYQANSDITSLLVHGSNLYASLYSGDILKCVANCTIIGKVTNGMNPLTIGDYLYIGLNNGTVFRCELQEFKCQIQWNVGGVNTLKAIGGYVYAGLQNGQLWRLSLTDPNVLMQNMDNEIKGISSLQSNIYAITNNGNLWKCAPKALVCASVVMLSDKNLIDMVTMNGRLYIVKCRTHIRMYKLGDGDSTVYVRHENISRLAFVN